MPKVRDMRRRKCVSMLAATLSNPNILDGRGEIKINLETLRMIDCWGEKCSHWIWDEGPYRDGKTLDEDRRGHCGKTQHKPFVIQAATPEQIKRIEELLGDIATKLGGK